MVRMVNGVVSGFHLYGEMRRDAHQEAWLGVCQAARSYRAEKGTTFVAWARPRARGAVGDYLRQIDPLTRLQRQAVKSGRDPGPRLVSLHQLRLPSLQPSPYDIAVRFQRRDTARRLLAKLTPSQRHVITRLFWDDASLSQLGRDSGVTPSGVFYQREAALSTMRAAVQ